MTSKKRRVTQIMVCFSGHLNADQADPISPYHLATPSKRGSHTAKGAKAIALKSALYSVATSQGTLTLRKPFKITKPVQLLIHRTGPSGLQDSLGRLIDGNHDGQAGGDAVAILSRKGVSLDRVSHSPADARRASHPSAVDALLERGDLIGLRRSGVGAGSHRLPMGPGRTGAVALPVRRPRSDLL
jgi:hypothetical protein